MTHFTSFLASFSYTFEILKVEVSTRSEDYTDHFQKQDTHPSRDAMLI